MPYDLARLRQLFPSCRDYVYLDHAGVAPCSSRARDAVTTWVERLATRGVLDASEWEEALERARGRAARLLGASADEIAFVRSTSHGLSLIAEGLPWRPGDEVVICSKLEYPSNVYTWKQLERGGVRVREVEPEDGAVTAGAVAAQMSEGTRLVAVSSVQFATGRVTDLAAIGALCAERGALLAVDGIQSVGAFPLDVKDTGVHFLSADSHKWMLGLVGIGLFFVDASVVSEVRPAIVGWRTTADPWAFDGTRFSMRPDARRFEEGSLPHPLIDGLEQSLAILEEVGVDAIAGHIRALLDRAEAGLCAAGCRVSPPREARAGILLFSPPAGEAGELVEELVAAGFVLSLRRGRIRISPHLYNTEEEIDRLVSAVRAYSERRSRR